MKKKLLLLAVFIGFSIIAFAQRGLENIWHETGNLVRGEECIQIHADINPATIKKGGYYFVVRFFDANGNPIKEVAPTRRGAKMVPLIIQTGLPSIMDKRDLKDYTVNMPFRRLRDGRQGRMAYYKVFLSQDPYGRNAVSESALTKFYVSPKK